MQVQLCGFKEENMEKIYLDHASSMPIPVFCTLGNYTSGHIYTSLDYILAMFMERAKERSTARCEIKGT